MAENFEQRIRRLEDIESIKRLKARYCYLVDAGIGGDESKWDELMACFTDDARADFEFYGVHEGKRAVAAFFKEIVASALSYSAHMVTNPLIEVNGDTATGKWYFHVPCTGRATNTAGWLQGRYEEEYVRIDRQWKWKSITTRFDHITPFDVGWVKTRFASM